MSGRWEKYVEPAAVAMNGGHQRHAVDRWGPEVHTVLDAVGPLIAGDSRNEAFKEIADEMGLCTDWQLDDPRIGYVDVQLDKDTYRQLMAAGEIGKGC
jgi:hypothetical protein